MLKFRKFFGAMEAVNHLKNYAMVAETILKHGASLKSHTSMVNRQWFIIQ